MRTDSTQNQWKLIKNNCLLHYYITEMECLEEEMNTVYRVIFEPCHFCHSSLANGFAPS